MSTYNTTSIYFCDTDAEFRALIVIFLASLTNCGWTQTADTGQVNTSTVTYPASNNADATSGSWLGYMDDSLHSTTPIYMKCTFGRGAAAGSFRVLLSFSITGTNGTGTLISGTSTATVVISGAPNARVVSDATNYNIYASGGTGRWGVTWWPDVTASPFGRFIMIERWKNSDGTANGNGFSFQMSGFHGESSTTSITGFHWRKGATYTPGFDSQAGGAPTSPSINFIRGTGNNFGKTVRSIEDTVSSLHAGKVYAFPFYPVAAGEKYPLTQVLLCSIFDFPIDFTNVTLTMYGSSMTFKPMGVNANDANAQSNATSAVGLLLRYE